MSEVSSLWWTDERIEATLCRQYVFSQLQPEHQTQLFEPLPWGEGLTSETYLEWILTKAGKLFLILNELGIPQRIFNLADDFVDDSDLPFAESRVSDLPLVRQDDQSISNSAAAALHNKFFLVQWRYLVRGIKEGEHVRYTENEGVPVEVVKTGLVNSNNNKDGVEKVVLSGATCRVFLRTQVRINVAPYFSEEDEVLEEIRSLRQLAHEHVLSIYGSYTVDNSINVLFNGVYERSLMSFLSDTPQNFKRLPKPDRREILVNWPHCLASGLAWLHANGHPHGSIRPSNVLVDSDYRIFLGHFEGLDTLLDSPKINDIEAYQYAAPERWIRTTAIQETNAARNAFHSGGRTTRIPSSSSSTSGSSSSASSRGTAFTPRSSWMTAGSSQSSESKGTVIRVGSRNSLASSSSSSASGGSGGSHGKSAHKLFRTKPILYTPPIHSSNLACDSRTRPVTAPENAASIPFVPHNTALVRTWQSQQVDAQLSDIFSLGAVITDIFTFLCERKISSFASHRSAKNRTPGRGGGVADASFHLITNLPQVSSWLTLLTQDSKKRKGLAFRAVEPMLNVVRDMIARIPDRRPSAEEVEAGFAHAIRQLDGIIVAHCKQSPAAATTSRKPTTPSAPVDMPLPPSPDLHRREYESVLGGSKPRRQVIINYGVEDDDYPDPSLRTKEKDQQRRGLPRLDLGYEFDFGFPARPRDQSPSTPTSYSSTSTPPPSSGNSYSSFHHQHQQDHILKPRQYQHQQRQQQNTKQNKEKYEHKDRDGRTIDETILHLRKALEEKLSHDSTDDDDIDDEERKRRREKRRYYDDLAMSLNGSNLNLPSYEA
ncbi:protein kinase domain-containing protein [Talaromyces stipitatus ATCC 10500]|uniref:Protein kinase domain-containing protein n=1 Tax=Talaromyces stipitatus (strain ATCC 10500 / CBS 375.48 / QM 6759 / NRRL 1006) TaxID=441959 RepID=B8M6K1_TALSN|nr:protein kinase domain-containing protein [Talaromyces stipitatus ATCC 10500]EED19463.1 protein kinase domain-containing protein [Talaromyces stipitatus ATCC 10500]